MPWGDYYAKRRYNDDIVICDQCGDEYDCENDDSGDCGCCEEAYCSTCVAEMSACTRCKERGVDTADICESCIAFPGCEACDSDDDFILCINCVAPHKAECNKKSRAQRLLDVATHNLETKQTKHAKLSRQLASLQGRLQDLNREIAEAMMDQAACKLALEKETAEKK